MCVCVYYDYLQTHEWPYCLFKEFNNTSSVSKLTYLPEVIKLRRLVKQYTPSITPVKTFNTRTRISLMSSIS